MKKLISLVLALAMIMVVGLASAQTVGTAAADKGSITISNASNGDTYKVYKLFDATLSGTTGTSDGIAYTGTIPPALADYFTTDEAGNIHKAEGKSDPQIAAAVQSWAAAQDKAGVTPAASATSDGSALTFEGLDYGYYAITSTLGATVTVNSTHPNATVIDKNSSTPSAAKEADDESYSVGDTVTYTATFDAPNYLGDDASQEQVVSYIIKDTLPSFLSDVVITSVKVKKGTNETALSGYTAFNDEGEIEIPWVNETVPTTDHKYTSTYASGSQIEVIYTATVTRAANVGAANTNTVSLFPQVDRGNGKEPYQTTDEWNASDTITTHAAKLKKVDENHQALAGAEFTFQGLTLVGANGMYSVVSYDPDSTAAGTRVKTDANGELTIAGIDKDITLIGTEVKAPAGYNKMAGTFNLATVEMSSTTTTSWGTKTEYYDADGNLVDTQVSGGSSTVTENAYDSVSDIPSSAVVEVVNNKGTELPSTGGIGTTIFYILGGLLVVGAAIVLVARRKAND